MTDTEQVKAVMKDALKRMEEGRKKYGEYDPATDKRALLVEMEEEMLDFVNYACLEVVRLRFLRKKWAAQLDALERKVKHEQADS